MTIQFGQSLRIRVDETKYVDLSYYDKRWSTEVNMSLWEVNNPVALNSIDKRYLKAELILKKDQAERYYQKKLNKQYQKVLQPSLV